MRNELNTAEAEEGDTHQSQQLANKPSSRTWHVLSWLLLGGLMGAALAAVFLAYGQPELLLEQLNLRYCG